MTYCAIDYASTLLLSYFTSVLLYGIDDIPKSANIYLHFEKMNFDVDGGFYKALASLVSWVSLHGYYYLLCIIMYVMQKKEAIIICYLPRIASAQIQLLVLATCNQLVRTDKNKTA